MRRRPAPPPPCPESGGSAGRCHISRRGTPARLLTSRPEPTPRFFEFCESCCCQRGARGGGERAANHIDRVNVPLLQRDLIEQRVPIFLGTKQRHADVWPFDGALPRFLRGGVVRRSIDEPDRRVE